MDFRRQPPKTPDGRYPAQISGAKRYHEYLNRERQKEIYKKTAERKMPNDKMTLQDAETKGSLPIQDLDKPLDDKDNLYLTAEKEKAKADKKAAAIRKTVVFVLCFVLSFLLSITSVRIPLTPSTVRIDFFNIWCVIGSTVPSPGCRHRSDYSQEYNLPLVYCQYSEYSQ